MCNYSIYFFVGNPLWYVLVVLIFYSGGLIILMIRHMKEHAVSLSIYVEVEFEWNCTS